jgi:hypothetical protein
MRESQIGTAWETVQQHGEPHIVLCERGQIAAPCCTVLFEYSLEAAELSQAPVPPISKIPTQNMAVGVAQVVEHLPSK